MTPATSNDAYVTSPAGLAVNSTAYRFIKLRVRKQGAPKWDGQLRWKKAGASFDNTNLMTIPEPVWDANNTATITVNDIAWTGTDTIDQIRLDLTSAVDATNYIQYDWIAIGRPTPGAGMAALQTEQTARVVADAAEATQRNTLAVQMRGPYTGTDASQVTSGLIYSEQQLRISGDKAEATARQSLETKLDNSVSTINKSLDTLNTSTQANASDITGLKSSLQTTNNTVATKADASAVNALTTKVNTQGDSITSQGNNITSLNNNITGILQQGAAININPLFNTADGWHMALGTVWSATAGDGKAGVIMTKNGTSNPELYPNDGNWNLVSGARQYRFIVRGKSLGGAGNIIVRRHYKDSPSGTDNSNDIAVTFPTDSFATKTIDFPATPGATTMVYFQAYCYPSNATVAIDSFSVYDITDALTGTANASAISALSSTVTQQGSTLTSQGNSITSLSNSISLQQGRGNNLVTDGGFESYSATSGALIVDGSHHSGSSSAKFIRTKATGAGGNQDQDYGGWFDAAGNQVFYVEAWCRYDANSASKTGSARFGIHTKTAAGADNWGQAFAVPIASLPTNSSWVKFSGYVSAPSDTVQAILWMCFSQTDDNLQNTSMLVDDVFISDVTAGYNAQTAADAAASAVSSLGNTVTSQGTTITSQGNAITTLTNNLATTNANVTKKADASAVSTLQTTVNNQGNTITSQGNAITQLQNTVTTQGNTLAQKADASALNNYYTRTQADTATAGQISAFSAAMVVGGRNLLANTATINNAGTTDGSFNGNRVATFTKPASNTNNYSDLSNPMTINPVTGDTYVYSFYARSLNDGDSMNCFFYSPNTTTSATTSQGKTSTSSDGQVTFTLSKTMTRYWVVWKQSATTTQKSVVMARINKDTTKDQQVWLSCPQLEAGNVPTDWSPAPEDVAAGTTANSSAISTLQTTVTNQGNTITSQGNSITSLQNSVSSINNNLPQKADVSALNTLSTTVANQGSSLTSQGSRITNLEGSVSVGDNLVPNPDMLNNATGWHFRTIGVMNGQPYVQSVAGDGYAPATPSFSVAGGDVLDVAFMARMTSAANGIKWNVRFDGDGFTNKTVDVSTDNYAATEHKAVSGTVTAPDGANVAYLQPGQAIPSGNDLMLWDVRITRRSQADTANAKAIDTLTNTVTSQGNTLTSVSGRTTTLENTIKNKADSSALSSLQSTVTSQGNTLTSQGNSITSLQNGLNSANTAISTKANASALDTLQNTVTNQGNSITSQGSSITSLTNSVGQQQAKGSNLVTDGGFESYTATTGTLITDGSHHSGSKSAKAIRTAGTNTGGNNDISYGGWFACRGSQIFYVEVWARIDANSTAQTGISTMGVWTQTDTGANNWTGAFNMSLSSLPTDSSWVKFSGYVKAPSNAVKGIFWLSIPQRSDNPQGTSFLIDDVFVCDVTDGYNAQQTADGNSSAITSLQNTVSQQGSSITSQSSAITRLQSDLTATNNNVATKASTTALNSLQTTVTNQGNTITSQGNSISSLNSTVGTNTADIKSTASAVATLNTTVSATWSLKVQTDSNGNKQVAGIGLSSDSGTGSQFLVQANRFALISGTNGTVTTPFVVQNGQTYIQTAFIADASITSAKVGDLQSTNYVSNKSGWRISKDGSLNLNLMTAGTGGRMVINNDRIVVYDDTGAVSVVIGLLL